MNKNTPSKAKKRKTTSEDEPSTSKKVKKLEEDSSEVEPEWRDYELLAEQKQLDFTISENIIKLFSKGNTIPFIARYRRSDTGNMDPEDLRDVKECYEEICDLKSKINTVVQTVNKMGQLNPKLRKSIVSVRSAEELELIYAPFKPEGRKTLAERAKKLGLEEVAMKLLNNTGPVNLNSFVDKNVKELSKLQDVEQGVIHIIASVISSDTDLLSYLRNLRTEVNFLMETKKSHAKVDVKSTKPAKPVKEFKFELYFNFKSPTKFLKPHQILAINRGESLKVLSVKIVVPDFFHNKFTNFCIGKWMNVGPFDGNRKRLIMEAIQDCYTRLIQPLIIREVRAELKQKACKASCEVFAKNLKHLLLAPPLKGKPILGIDPGFSNGCKVAMVTKTGVLLDHVVIYPHTKKVNWETVIKDLLLKHNCELIALGNGTACRETETWLSRHIQNGVFRPLDVKYTIVDENGVSIYSCSPEAKKEFPDVDPNIISAISLARRLQEPLAELVKVEPQHLGVGMYQHDLKKKQLDEALDEVVSECVSFVGVDLNTASECLLRRIAGLTEKRASQIIKYREENGQFKTRKQLTKVKGIGVKIFEQCAGFLRVGPTNKDEAVDFYKDTDTTKLDCTYIHPESYGTTKKLLQKLKLKLKDVGDEDFIDKIKRQADVMDKSKMCSELGCGEATLNLILDALSKPLNYDLRTEVSKEPLFKKGLTSINDIGPGTEMTGRATNVTHFGVFVDIGVGTSGLIHCSKTHGLDLQIGDRVEVKVVSVDVEKGRIQLEAVKKL